MRSKKPTHSDLMGQFIKQLPKSQWPESENRDAMLAQVTKLLPLYARAHGFLKDSGWLRSARTRRPLDAAGNPVPWYTYPTIDFLAEKDLSALSVFEFGSGGSTIWWAGKADKVTAVEHAKAWVDEMRPKLPANVTYLYEDLVPDGAYCRAAKSTGNRFDVIVNDGRDRVNCAFNTLEALSDRGIIIWDNAERARYQAGYDFLIGKGFRRLNFHGFGPINSKRWLTSIFYRDGNCLGL